MRQLYLDLAARLEGGGHAEALWHSMECGYENPQRAYHNLTHLETMHRLLSDCTIENRRACSWALLYHDAVYEPGSSDNEEKSAELAKRDLNKLGEDREIVALVARLILSTKNHADPQTRDEMYFLDADMAILGFPLPAYDIYTQQIRQEFSKIPDSVFYSRRKEFLPGLERREQWYYTPKFARLYETQARENVRREIERISTVTNQADSQRNSGGSF